MSDRATLQAELLLLCGKVRDDTLTPGDAARLDELLQADDAAKQLYVRYMSVVSLLESRGMGQRVTSEEPEQAEAIDHNVFAELLELESKAEAELVEQAKPIRLFVPNEKTPWQIGGALRWTAQQPAVWSGAAAVFVIAVVLFFVFNGNETSQPIADQPDPSGEQTTEPGPVAPAQNIVATLTAEHDAVWESQPSSDVRPDALRPGTPLSAGQRLVLTQGLAEITTNDGAIAIIQAPATIELFNNNALHLHAGKLVGKCYTESSKGFTVKTDHADITDIGTEFGVELEEDGQLLTYVFDGQVQVQLSNPDGREFVQNLFAGQTYLAGDDGAQLLAQPPQLDFVRSLASGYEIAAMKLGPVGYWSFDTSPNDNTLSNQVWPTYRGLLTGGARLSEAYEGVHRRRGNHALQLDGVDEEVLIKDVPEVTPPSTSYSVAMWVKPELIRQQNLFLRTNDEGPSIKFSCQLKMTDDGQFEHYVYVPDAQHEVQHKLTGRTPAQVNKWCHVVIVVDGSKKHLRLFVDGTEDAAYKTLPGAIWSEGDQYRVGSGSAVRDLRLESESNIPGFKGMIDELAVYRRALSAQEIESLYNAANKP